MTPDIAPPHSPLRAAIPRHPWLWLCAFIIACGWDRAIYLASQATSASTIEALEQLTPRQALALSYSWELGDALILGQYLAYFTVKLFGTAYLAAAIAAVIILRSFVQPDTGRVRIALRRGVLLFLSVAAGGLLAEALKLVFRRQRPEFADGHYSFRFSDWFNASGLERALAFKDKLTLSGSISLVATEGFCKKNLNRTLADNYEAMRKQTALHLEKGVPVKRIGVMAAFGCNYSGDVPAAQVVERVADGFRLAEEAGAGIEVISLADTMGWAIPPRIEKVIGAGLVLTGALFLTGGMPRIAGWLLETFPVLGSIG